MTTAMSSAVGSARSALSCDLTLSMISNRCGSGGHLSLARVQMRLKPPPRHRRKRRRPSPGGAFNNDGFEIAAIPAWLQRAHELCELAAVDEAHSQGNLLGTGDLQSGTLLEDAHELACLVEIFGRAAIEPGAAASDLLHGELAQLKIHPVEIGDLELAARGAAKLSGELQRPFVVEIEAGHGEVAFRLRGLFRERDRPAVAVELHHAVALRLRDLVGKDG